MDLTLHQAPSNAVRGMNAGGVIIGDQQYSQSLIVSADRLQEQWPVTSASQLNRDHAQQLLTWQPALVIVGTGSTLTFPPADFAATLMARHVGLESMDNAAACRTYNVLLDEGRAVVLALIAE